MRVLCVLLLLPWAVFAQPRDTSFTIYSAFIKAHEKFPFIKIAKSNSDKIVSASYNVVYDRSVRDLHLDVFWPTKKDKNLYPGILLIHGGGWRSGDRSQVVPMAQALALKGYVAVAVEYRLSLEAPYPAAIYDLKSAVRWMRTQQQYPIDKSKIIVLGFSAGGQLAALLGMLNGDERGENIQAVIDIDGILAFKHPESEEGAAAELWLGGTYEQKSEQWRDASPLTHVSSKAPPILFINSSLPRFHAGRDDMIMKLDSMNIYSEVHTIPDTPHTFWLFDPWFDQTVSYVERFLKKIFNSVD